MRDGLRSSSEGKLNIVMDKYTPLRINYDPSRGEGNWWLSGAYHLLITGHDGDVRKHEHSYGKKFEINLNGGSVNKAARKLTRHIRTLGDMDTVIRPKDLIKDQSVE
tara:strand:+ start:186 stop:506 length:321 start_codon:yes stop_codon:yes gene_type:complete